MEKAFDLKDLQTKLVAAGLPEVEDLAEKVYGAVKAWVKESGVITESPLIKMAAGFVDTLDGVVVPILNKIDGKEG